MGRPDGSDFRRYPWATPPFRPGLAASFAHLEHRQEGLLRNIHPPDPLHPLLSFLLFLKQLAFAGNVAPVALGKHVLTHRWDGFASDNLRPDRRLDCDLEHLPRAELLHLGPERLATLVAEVAVHD